MSSLVIKKGIAPQSLAITLPASKSICNRALVLGAVSGNLTLQHISEADDSLVMQRALQQATGTVNVKNAGTCMRFLTAYYAAVPGTDIVLHGSQRMHQRPVGPLVDALRQLGADIGYIDRPGFPPLRIKGKKLPGGAVQVDASVSSQFTSALMLAAPLFTNGVVISRQQQAVSRPYIDMTAALMKQCGFEATTRDDIVVKPGPAQALTPRTIDIEPDWSAASYWYAIAACGGVEQVLLERLPRQSIQGDAEIERLMRGFGVGTAFGREGALLGKAPVAAMPPARFDMTDFPDLVPALAVTACALNRECTFADVAHLESKESRRLTALCTELGKCGFDVTHNGSELLVRPVTGRIQAPSRGFDTYDDHRMAMCFAPLALLFGEIRINGAGVVEKSYPHFWSDLEKAGFVIVPSGQAG